MARNSITEVTDLEKQILYHCDIKTISSYAAVNKTTQQVYSNFEFNKQITELKNLCRDKWFEYLVGQNNIRLIEFVKKSGFLISYYCNFQLVDQLITKKQTNLAIYFTEEMVKLGSTEIVKFTLQLSIQKDDDVIFPKYYDSSIMSLEDAYKTTISYKANKIFRLLLAMTNILENIANNNEPSKIYGSLAKLIDDSLIIGAFDITDILMQKLPSKIIYMHIFSKAIVNNNYAFCELVDKYQLELVLVGKDEDLSAVSIIHRLESVLVGRDEDLLADIIKYCCSVIVVWFLRTFKHRMNQNHLRTVTMETALQGRIDILDFLMDTDLICPVKVEFGGLLTNPMQLFNYGGFMWLVERNLLLYTQDDVDQIILFKDFKQMNFWNYPYFGNYTTTYLRMIEYFISEAKLDVNFEYALNYTFRYKYFEGVKFLCLKYQELVHANSNVKKIIVFNVVSTAINYAGYKICKWFFDWLETQNMWKEFPDTPITVSELDPADCDVLDLATKQNIKLNFYYIHLLLIKDNRIDILEWINNFDPEYNFLPGIDENALIREYYDVLEWRKTYCQKKDKKLHINSNYLIMHAVNYNNVTILIWLHKHGFFDKIAEKIIISYTTCSSTYLQVNTGTKMILTGKNIGIYHWLLDHPCENIVLTDAIQIKKD